MRFNDAYIICIETISVHAFRSDAKLKPFQMRFMFTGVSVFFIGFSLYSNQRFMDVFGLLFIISSQKTH